MGLFERVNGFEDDANTIPIPDGRFIGAHDMASSFKFIFLGAINNDSVIRARLNFDSEDDADWDAIRAVFDAAPGTSADPGTLSQYQYVDLQDAVWESLEMGSITKNNARSFLGV